MLILINKYKILIKGKIMNKKSKSLTTTSIYAGIIGFLLIVLYNSLSAMLFNFLKSRVTAGTIAYILIAFIVIILGLSMAAIICGSIDLSRINKGISSKRGRLFDLIGISLGSVSFIVSAILLFGEIISL